MHTRIPDSAADVVLALRSELRFNARFDTLWSIGGRLVLWTGYVAPRPAPPQALYLADCNQITCVFTWVIDPYLMPCLTRMNDRGSPDLDSPIITHVFAWAINPYLMPVSWPTVCRTIMYFVPNKVVERLRSELQFNACFDTLSFIGGHLMLWTSHVTPCPAPPQALYLADCNQITRVFTWVIDPYLMPCLTRVNDRGSPDLDSPIFTRVFTWAINSYLMPCPDQPSAEQLSISFPIKLSSIFGLNFMFNARSNTFSSHLHYTVYWHSLPHLLVYVISVIGSPINPCQCYDSKLIEKCLWKLKCHLWLWATGGHQVGDGRAMGGRWAGDFYKDLL